MTDRVRVAVKTLRVMGPDVTKTQPFASTDLAETMITQQVAGINWAAAEDAINDQLPEGWYCKLEDA